MMKLLIALGVLMISTLVTAQQDNSYASCLMNGATFNPTTGLSSNSYCTFLANGTFARCNNTRINATTANASLPWACTNQYKRDELLKRPTTYLQSAETNIIKLDRQTLKF
jgi:hypothetical protein